MVECFAPDQSDYWVIYQYSAELYDPEHDNMTLCCEKQN